MLKNLKTGDRFVDEIGRVFLVKKVIPDGYETEFIGLTDYEEGQKPYKLEDKKKKADRKAKTDEAEKEPLEEQKAEEVK